MKLIITCFLVFFSFGLAAQQLQGYTAPKPTGPWSVGKQLLEWVDSSRREPTDSTQLRTLPVWVWYPAQKNTAAIPGYPLAAEWRKEQGKYLEAKLGTGASQFLQALKVWSVPDVPGAHSKEKVPGAFVRPGPYLAAHRLQCTD